MTNVKLLNAYNMNEDVVTIFGKPNDQCDELGKSIKLIKKLGSGEKGEIWLIEKNGVKKPYVMKKELDTEDMDKTYVFTFDIDVINTEDKLLDLYKELNSIFSKRFFKDINVERLQRLNRGALNTGILIFPTAIASDCKINKEILYDNFHIGRLETVEKDGYVCFQLSYTEYLNSLLVSQLYTTGVCFNFVEMIDFWTCGVANHNRTIDFDVNITEIIDETIENTNTHFIFMELLTGMIFGNYLTEFDENYYLAEKDGDKEEIKRLKKEYISCLFQIMFALECMQRKYKMMHNDLHHANIFITEIDDQSWEGNLLKDFDVFEYQLDGESYYVSPIILKGKRYLIKLIDFGFAIKYSEPQIFNWNFIERNSYIKDYMVNSYSTSYDLLMVLNNTFMIQYEKVLHTLSLAQRNQFLDPYYVNKTGRFNPKSTLEEPLSSITPKDIIISSCKTLKNLNVNDSYITIGILGNNSSPNSSPETY